jgi:ABC-2 type transport system ATP-binding protein
VPEGAVLGLLGPNGAGKTTTVRILATLLQPTSGRATVAGLDVVHDARALRRVIGLSGQFAAVDDYLTGRENLVLFGRLYHLTRAASRARAEELLEQFDLTEAANRIAKTYSGGIRRRLDLASSLVAKPRVLMLDEPTTGLDPRGRMAMWDVIASLVRAGATLLLTTQYLEEADRLADSIVVVDHGTVIASGTADELRHRSAGSGSRSSCRTAPGWRRRSVPCARCAATTGRLSTSAHGRSWRRRWVAQRCSSRSSGNWTAAESASTTSRCAARLSTTCSSP